MILKGLLLEQIKHEFFLEGESQTLIVNICQKQPPEIFC